MRSKVQYPHDSAPDILLFFTVRDVACSLFFTVRREWCGPRYNIRLTAHRTSSILFTVRDSCQPPAYFLQCGENDAVQGIISAWPRTRHPPFFLQCEIVACLQIIFYSARQFLPACLFFYSARREWCGPRYNIRVTAHRTSSTLFTVRDSCLFFTVRREWCGPRYNIPVTAHRTSSILFTVRDVVCFLRIFYSAQRMMRSKVQYPRDRAPDILYTPGGGRWGGGGAGDGYEVHQTSTLYPAKPKRSEEEEECRTGRPYTSCF